jgi:glycolate oxidase FAD binding subunit
MALARAGQFLPLDPPHADEATIGGVVAANSTGFWRSRYGGVRDLLIGATTVLGDGTIARSGGRVVKNVAGYDLNKLLVGSLGTLGVVVECTFKVVPRPALALGLRARFTRGADAFAVADAIVRTPARAAAVAISGRPGAGWELLLEAFGDAAPVERTLALVAQAASVHGAAVERRDDVRQGLTALNEISGRASGTVVRAALPLAAQPAFATTAARLEGFAELVADAASGIVRVELQAEDTVALDGAGALLAAARVCGGTARIEHRPPSVRARARAWADTEPAGRSLMRRLKDAFDPRGILEPGRSALG